MIGATQAEAAGQDFAVGDFNNDGQPDLAILAAGTTIDNIHPPMIIVLFNASSLAGTVDLASYPGPKTIIKAVPGDAGTRAAIASGDFNGDQISDIALGVPNNSQATNYDGKAYIVFGSATWPGQTILLQSPSATTCLINSPPGTFGWLGMELTSGDINRDGHDELLVSAPFHSPGGRVYVIHGREIFPASINLATATTGLTQLVETDAYQACGVGLACADADADGFDDILIGSPGDGVDCHGTVSLLMGWNLPSSVIPLSQETPGIKRFYGEYEHGQLGWRVRFADVNGDALRDIAMAAPVADPNGCEDCGEIYVVYWNASLPDSIDMGSTNISMTRFVGSGSLQLCGERMSAGLFNADLCEDLVIKREPDGSIPGDRRSVIVAYGSASLGEFVYLNTDASVTRILAEQPGDKLGRGLLVADFDGDGLGNLVAGAPQANVPGRVAAGKTHVFEGCETVSHVRPTRSPSLVALSAFPNPFSGGTTLTLTLAVDANVHIEFFNVAGALVRRLRSEPMRAGEHLIAANDRDADGRFLPSGVYFARVKVGNEQATHKLVIAR